MTEEQIDKLVGIAHQTADLMLDLEQGRDSSSDKAKVRKVHWHIHRALESLSAAIERAKQ